LENLVIAAFFVFIGLLLLGFFINFVDVVRMGIMIISPVPLRRFIHRKLLFWPLKKEYKKYLDRSSPFYRQLGPSEQKSFEKRMQRFIDTHEFISRGSNSRPVPDERIARISAVATELTYGLPYIYFEYFSRVLVYEDNYYSNITKKWHQGEVNVRGFIVLSWTNFMKGVEDADDGVHLGFHEMAHALQLEDHLEKSNYEFFEKQKLRRIQEIGKNLIQNPKRSFFRNSAFGNRYEFFAVAVESFFERPRELKSQFPELYQLLSELLHHDPVLFLDRGTPTIRYS